ncbi:tetratricopeptide repeat protein [Burkholderia territorii]|uniref:tetratricopeptide repeat protein n=2 Tax=Burkholderia cepacia complex TaxID=87882 RepID=UPI0018C878E5|nr:SIR2 family protein [Burkholderia territorii]
MPGSLAWQAAGPRAPSDILGRKNPTVIFCRTTMKEEDAQVIRDQICPLIEKGEIALLLGAGFSYRNQSINGEIPTGDGLKEALLAKCGAKPGPKTTLKDAYTYASRKIQNFNNYLRDFFIVDKAEPWQEKIFQYVWNRIYTTNIDNVLNVAHQTCKARGLTSAEFEFFNYCDQASASNVIGSTPVVAIHGTIEQLERGFIFSNLEYAIAANKLFDWHNELAARMLLGGLVVIGNQLDESDIDTYLSRRSETYGTSDKSISNWIVMPAPDAIKKENYVEAGYCVIDATAEEFFSVIYRHLRPKKIADLVLESIPAVKAKFASVGAMTWFKEAFSPILQSIEKSHNESGILRHFVTGAHPEWFYITNDAHAKTPRIEKLTQFISTTLSNASEGIGLMHIIGPSGSGKTTGIRSALLSIADKYPYIYEYGSSNGIDVNKFISIISGFSEKSKAVFVFYSAAEFYYAINSVARDLQEKIRSYCLFILEDRIYDFKVNSRHLPDVQADPAIFEFGSLTYEDAKAICTRISNHAIKLGDFSELSLEKQAGTLMNRERGFNGDLLSALYSLTTHENFETKIFNEYHAVKDKNAKSILSVVAILNHLGFSVPVNYVAGITNITVPDIEHQIATNLSGIVVDFASRGVLTCRHRVIADCYFENCIAQNGTQEQILDILEYLSNKFTIEDIKYHPLPYQFYKSIISFDFLYEQYFPYQTRKNDAERVYHHAQKLYGKDGVFWLQFGRFYRKIGRFDDAIDCFRTGLDFYDSFQTRHSLGVALVAKYIHEKFNDRELLVEGLEYLEYERLRRGISDPYPTATICGYLIRICRAQPKDTETAEKLRECINFGIKHFKEDEYFARQLKLYLRMTTK